MPTPTPTVARPSKVTASARTGPWKVLGIVAERLPAKDLLPFTRFIVGMVLGTTAIAAFGLHQMASSKPASFLIELVEGQFIRKAPTVQDSSALNDGRTTPPSRVRVHGKELTSGP